MEVSGIIEYYYILIPRKSQEEKSRRNAVSPEPSPPPGGADAYQDATSHTGLPRRAGLTSGYLYSFERMDFQQMGKQDNAGRFERGCLKVTTENLTNWYLPGCEKPPKTNE